LVVLLSHLSAINQSLVLVISVHEML